jgi:methyl-accepting chemotaxis protein
MQQGTDEVKEGLGMAFEAGQALEEVVANVQQVSEMVLQIAAASEEQSTTSIDISGSVEAISRVTGASAEGITEIAEASDILFGLTQTLDELVAKFKIEAEIPSETTRKAQSAAVQARKTADRVVNDPSGSQAFHA